MLKKRQIIWAIWILILGASLFFGYLINSISSFLEYLRAFTIFDMPASWCPTFLTLYGLSTLLMLVNKPINKVFTFISNFSGSLLLLIGIYALYTFSVVEPISFTFMYIHAQAIHISEILTGIFTLSFILKKPK